jgi:hypothetical protein
MRELTVAATGWSVLAGRAASGYLVVTLNRFQTLTRAISMMSEARACSS